MRRLLVLIILVVLFVVLFFFIRSAASWKHAVVTGDAGALLYVASFDGGAADGFNADWEQYAGQLSAQLDAGQLRISVGKPKGRAYSVAAPYYADFDLRVEARAVEGPIDNGYGVVFRLQDKANSNFEDNSYYVFLISSDGFYQVSRVVDGDEKIISVWNQSPLVNQGLDAVNRLRVIARSDQFSFYINDQPVQLCVPDDPNGESTFDALGNCMGTMIDTLTDATIPNGQIGVSAIVTDTGGEGVVAAFDNVVVYAPD